MLRDRKTGDSLGCAFIQFESKVASEEARFVVNIKGLTSVNRRIHVIWRFNYLLFLQMDNAVIDDRRICVEFERTALSSILHIPGKKRNKMLHISIIIHLSLSYVFMLNLHKSHSLAGALLCTYKESRGRNQ